MSAPSWADLEALFHSALARSPAERAAFLAEHCAGRLELQAEVEALIRTHESAASALELPSMMTPQTWLKAGMRLGSYDVLSELGIGGMGEVYRARDTKLGRDVAIKILPRAFTADPERLMRFEREAHVLASLNHPNIAAIHGIEHSDGMPVLVLELVDGPSLADRIAKGPMPLDDVLPIATQIAEALEAAHEQAVVHRDLKPANIKVRADGTVKVLDFGLAKALEPAIVRADVSQSPITQAGVMLGTAAYMSPEQAKGKPTDKRSDLWAFGCVLYEMLTGKLAFPGEDIAETLAAVVKAEPDWHALPADTPSNLRTLLFRCLQKDLKKRTRDAGDIVIELDEALSPPATTTAGTVAPILSRRSLLVAVTGLLLGGLITGLAVWRLRPAPMAPVSRFTLNLPPRQRLVLSLTAIAVSPDGRRLVYVASSGGPPQLYLREMDNSEGKPIAGTEDAADPFFSPDGQWVGFFTLNALKKVSINGGLPVTLATALFGRGATWGSDGNIVFAPDSLGGLSMVSAAEGGTVRALTSLAREKGERSHRFPHDLPVIGRAVLFTVGTADKWDDARIEVLNLDTGKRKVLIEGGSDARYVPTGHLVYHHAGTLMAVPFDLRRMEVTGSKVPVAEGVMDTNQDTGAAQAAFTETGSLFYVPGSGAVLDTTLTWVDRKGTEQPLRLPPRTYLHPRLSPNGQRVVLGISRGLSADLWVCDLPRGTLTRLTTDGDAAAPIWASDGTRVTFVGAGVGGLFWKVADPAAAAERLTMSDLQVPGQWTQDGETLAFNQLDPTTGSDIWTLSLKNGPKLQPLARTPYYEVGPTFSPDGHWVAYQSDEDGRFEVYVQPFPGLDSKKKVSTDGGTEPLWSHDGHELFYRNGDKMLAVATTLQPTFHASKPEVLFETPYVASPVREYDVTSDGRRFLMNKGSEQVFAATHVNVVLNWFTELQQRAPVQ